MSTIFQRDCLSCAISRNPCVLCGPLLRVPDLLSAARYVCELPEQEAIAMRTQNKKILIVDSDESVLIALERVLEEQGYETTTAWELNEALKLMDASRFDVLLVGDHPPDLNCERLLKLLRRGQLWTPCVVMHSAARHPFSEQYLQYLGAHGVACKWNDKEVLEEVKKCVADLHVAA
jgi:CheY-like chemotaxis protein